MKHFSYANVMATLAFAVAISGTAIAAGGYMITSADQIKPHTLRLIDFSRSAKRGLTGKRGPAGRRGATGPAGAVGPAGASGAQGATGPQGPAGQPGQPGSALAYAHVTSASALDTAASKGVVSFKHEGTGKYCFTLASTPVSVEVTPEVVQSSAVPIATATLDSSLLATAGCPAGSNAGVSVTRTDGTAIDYAFFVTFN